MATKSIIPYTSHRVTPSGESSEETANIQKDMRQLLMDSQKSRADQARSLSGRQIEQIETVPDKNINKDKSLWAIPLLVCFIAFLVLMKICPIFAVIPVALWVYCLYKLSNGGKDCVESHAVYDEQRACNTLAQMQSEQPDQHLVADELAASGDLDSPQRSTEIDHTPVASPAATPTPPAEQEALPASTPTPPAEQEASPAASLQIPVDWYGEVDDDSLELSSDEDDREPSQTTQSQQLKTSGEKRKKTPTQYVRFRNKLRRAAQAHKVAGRYHAIDKEISRLKKEIQTEERKPLFWYLRPRKQSQELDKLDKHLEDLTAEKYRLKVEWNELNKFLSR